MLKKIEIKNFKSIYNESIELGRVNVFIGENGVWEDECFGGSGDGECGGVWQFK